MKVVAWNINDYVTVQLTEFGLEVYRDYLYSFGSNKVAWKDRDLADIRNDDYRLRMQGCEIIEIFSPHMTLGSRRVFVDCVFNVEVEE